MSKYDWNKLKGHEGKTIEELTRIMEAPRITVYMHCRRMDFPFRKLGNGGKVTEIDWTKADFRHKIIKDIAKDLNTSYSNVMNYVRVNHIKYKRVPRNKYDFSNIDFKNLTSVEISKKVGCSIWMVYYYCEKHNIKFRRAKKYKSEPKLAKVKFNFNDVDFKTMKLREIAELVKCSIATAHNYREKWRKYGKI